MNRLLFCLMVAVAGCAGDIPQVFSSDSEVSEAVDFVRQVQPIFARRCYKCHGPNNDEAGLRLSSEESSKGELDSGEHAIVAGDLKSSAILARIRSMDEEERMPPEGEPLTKAQIELLKLWIDSGARAPAPVA